MLESLYNKVADLQDFNCQTTFKRGKNGFQHRCFLLNIVKNLRTPILKNICERLLQPVDKCDALRDLVAFVQFKKREKHPWRSVNFTKINILLHGCFSRFLNCTNAPKSRNASQMSIMDTPVFQNCLKF